MRTIFSSLLVLGFSCLKRVIFLQLKELMYMKYMSHLNHTPPIYHICKTKRWSIQYQGWYLPWNYEFSHLQTKTRPPSSIWGWYLRTTGVCVYTAWPTGSHMWNTMCTLVLMVASAQPFSPLTWRWLVAVRLGQTFFWLLALLLWQPMFYKFRNIKIKKRVFGAKGAGD